MENNKAARPGPAPWVCIALTGCVSLFSVATGVMLSSISADYGLGLETVGLLPSLASGGESLAYLLGGFWRGRRIGRRELMGYFICLFLTTLCMGLRPPFAVLCLLFGLLGLLVGALNFVSNTVVASAFPENRGRYISILYISMGTGCMLASLYPTMALDAGVYWGVLYRRYAAYVFALAAAAIAVLLPRIRRTGPINAGTHEDKGESAIMFLLRHGRLKLSLLCLAAFMYQGHQIVLVTWIASYVTQWMGLSAVSAGLALSLFSGGLLAGRLIAAMLTKRFTTRQLFVAGCLIGAGALGCGLAAGTRAALLVTFPLAGTATGWLLPMLVSSGYDLFPENTVAVASTVNTSCAVGGMFFSWLAGLIAHYASFPAAISFTVVNLLIAAALMLFIARPAREEKAA